MVGTYHILLIYSPEEGHLASFCLLALVSIVVMKMGVCIAEFLLSILLGICPSFLDSLKFRDYISK